MTSFTKVHATASVDETMLSRLTLPITCKPGAPMVALFVAPAGELNKPYLHEVMRRQAKKRQAERIVGGATIDNLTPEQQTKLIDERRDLDRELYAQFVLKGWENVVDDTGRDVPFNLAEAADFLKHPSAGGALPDWLFQSVRDYCESPANFRVMSQDAVAKNS